MSITRPRRSVVSVIMRSWAAPRRNEIQSAPSTAAPMAQRPAITPKPIARAVMFCLMDVSGSMNEHMKDLAKRFYSLLYLFLNRR